MKGILAGIAGIILLYFMSNIWGRKQRVIAKENEIVIRLNSFFFRFIKICTIFCSIFGALGITGIMGGLYTDLEDIIWIIHIFVTAVIFWGIWIYFSKKRIVVKNDIIYLQVLWKKYVIANCSNIKQTKNKLIFYENKRKITAITPIYEGYSEILGWMERQRGNNELTRIKSE